ncbi:hypothetical protein EV421DRAFT_1996592 [Armillaria borealis]|uniref:Uncharacterized protein n=1 Tax=Armillaria borealis TaxID=47425 RepID=A0AA39JZI9_9AGAR|nr:hypothetical protein EV421DRAFT_1996592 [Armillaria borealis]
MQRSWKDNCLPSWRRNWRANSGHSWYCQDTSDILTRDNVNGTSEVSLYRWTHQKEGENHLVFRHLLHACDWISKPHDKARINIPIKECASKNTCITVAVRNQGVDVNLSQAAFTPSKTFGLEAEVSKCQVNQEVSRKRNNCRCQAVEDVYALNREKLNRDKSERKLPQGTWVMTSRAPTATPSSFDAVVEDPGVYTRIPDRDSDRIWEN